MNSVTVRFLQVSSDGEVVEEFNLHGVCCFFASCNLSVTISFTIDEVNNVSFNRDCPTIIFTADGIVLFVVAVSYTHLTLPTKRIV